MIQDFTVLIKSKLNLKSFKITHINKICFLRKFFFADIWISKALKIHKTRFSLILGYRGLTSCLISDTRLLQSDKNRSNFSEKYNLLTKLKDNFLTDL